MGQVDSPFANVEHDSVTRLVSAFICTPQENAAIYVYYL